MILIAMYMFAEMRDFEDSCLWDVWWWWVCHAGSLHGSWYREAVGRPEASAPVTAAGRGKDIRILKRSWISFNYS
jgi:hypothetical protein